MEEKHIMLTLWGPIEITYPVLFVAVVALGLVSWALKCGKLLQVFPTLSWLVFIQVPFLMQSSGFVRDVAREQAYGIAIVGLFLVCGDLAGLLLMVRRHALGLRADAYWFVYLLAVVFAILIVWLPIYHLLHVTDIPLLDALAGGFSRDAAESREKFGKLLEIPRFYKILFNWITTLFGPLLVVLSLALIRSKVWRAVAVGTVFVWLSCYAILSTAKQPLLAFVIFATVAGVDFWSDRLRQVARVMIVGGFAAFMAFSIYYSAQLASFQNEVGLHSKAYRDLMSNVYGPDDLRGFSIGDVNRLIDSNQEPIYLRLPHYIVYRTFLTPVEVAYHWYAYFPRISGDWRAPAELVGAIPPGLTHAANRVGRWAYVQRFPDHYLDSVSAYASLDADAYSFGGLGAIALAGLLVLCVRCAAALASVTQFGRAVSALLICQLGMFVMSASAQAILVAQGAVILVVLSLIVWALSLVSNDSMGGLAERAGAESGKY